MELHIMAVISTAHLPQAVSEFLETPAAQSFFPFTLAVHERGFVVSCATFGDEAGDLEYRALYPALHSVRQWAWEHSCTYVQLDRDAAETGDWLPTYDW